ncbi:MAG: hypothetical protein GY838_15535 [bacterium]|nr:hypothetical protein [bacterium]
MKRPYLMSLIPLVMAIVLGEATGTECTDFGDESASYFFDIGTVSATGRFGELVVLSTASELRILDLTSDPSPTYVASRTNGATSLHISGTTLVAGTNNRINLYALPSLTQYGGITTTGAVELTGSGHRIAVVAGASFLLYDVSDPLEPVLLGSAEHGASWDECSIVMNGDHVVFTTTAGNYLISKRSALWSVDLNSGPDLAITKITNTVPFPTDDGVYLQQVLPWGDHFVLRGATYSATTRSFGNAFVAHFAVGEGGPGWGEYHVSPDQFFARMAPWNDDLLIISTDGARTTYLGHTGSMSDDPVSLVEADLKLMSYPLTAWPDLGLLRVGERVIAVDSIGEGASRWPRHGSLNARAARVHGASVFLLNERPWYGDPGDCGGWYLDTYDVSGESPVRLDRHSENCAFADVFWIVKNHAYVEGYPGRCIDISDPTEFGTADSWNVSNIEDLLAWDDVVLVSRRTGGLDVYDANEPANWRILASHPDLPAGSLRRVGDRLFILDRTLRSFDMTDPLSPLEVSNPLPVCSRLVGLGPNRILTASGELLRVHDITDVANPILVGEFDDLPGIRSVEATENRVYVTTTVGLTVLDVAADGYLTRIGGYWDPEIAYALVAGEQLFLSYGSLIPLDCHDTVPTAVAAFRCERDGAAIRVTWSSLFDHPGQSFEVLRLLPGQALEPVGWRPAVEGEHLIVDDRPGSAAVAYKLRLVDPEGRSLLLAESEPTGDASGVALPVLEIVPNPANALAKISFSLKRPGPVRLVVYAPNGRFVARLADRSFAAGTHEIAWHGRDYRDRVVSSGVYLVRLEAGGTVRAHRLTLLK